MRVYHGSYVKMDERQAADFFYNSKTFAQLADEGAKLLNKPWQEIFAMLKREMEEKHDGRI